MQLLIDEIKKAFARVIGLKLSIARDAGSMKNFQFGTVKPHPSGVGTVGDFALHVQCPRRFVTSDRIITGSADYWYPADKDPEVDLHLWREERLTPSLQEKRFLDVLKGYDAETKSCINATDQLVVERVDVDNYGGVQIHLSGGYRIELFPHSGRHDPFVEHWRLFEPFGSHFVVLPGEQFEIRG